MKKFISIFAVLMLFASMATNVFAYGEDRMYEIDYSASGWGNLRNWDVQCRSPFRTSSGADDQRGITGQYGNPRYNSSYSGYFAHTGTDFDAGSTGPESGVDVYSVKDSGTIKTKATSSSGYGNYYIIQYQETVNGVKYGFQTLYGHLYSFASGLSQGSTVSATTNLGVSGNTGNSSGVHLHLEFRPAQNSGSTSVYYSPSAFYWQTGTWGNNMQTINHTSSGNTISFRMKMISSGSVIYPYQNEVTLYYRAQGESTWKQTSMTRASNKMDFTKEMSELGYPTGTNIEYFVRLYRGQGTATTPIFYVYRPFYNRKVDTGTSLANAPTSIPFVRTYSAARSIQDNVQLQGGIEHVNISTEDLATEALINKGKEDNINAMLIIEFVEKIDDQNYVVKAIGGDRVNEEFNLKFEFPINNINNFSEDKVYSINCNLDGSNVVVPDILYVTEC